MTPEPATAEPATPETATPETVTPLFDLILLVDDDEITNFLHQRTIDKTGLTKEVAVARDGQEALDFITESRTGPARKPDLLFLDINMPGMNGFEFLDAYARLEPEERCDFVLIMLTTSLLKADWSKAQESGLVDEIVLKPLTSELLQRLADEHLHRHREGKPLRPAR